MTILMSLTTRTAIRIRLSMTLHTSTLVLMKPPTLLNIIAAHPRILNHVDDRVPLGEIPEPPVLLDIPNVIERIPYHQNLINAHHLIELLDMPRRLAPAERHLEVNTVKIKASFNGRVFNVPSL